MLSGLVDVGLTLFVKICAAVIGVYVRQGLLVTASVAVMLTNAQMALTLVRVTQSVSTNAHPSTASVTRASAWRMEFALRTRMKNSVK